MMRQTCGDFRGVLAMAIASGMLLLAFRAEYVVADELSDLDADIAYQDCGSLDNAFGPFDYTNSDDVRAHLPIVERFHFNSNVESLKSGQSGVAPGADLDYTLRVFPNHHRALYSMVRYALANGVGKVPPGANYTGECYLKRAVQFRPNDPSVRIIYGIFLSRSGHDEASLEQYKSAVRIAPNSAEAHYNLALKQREMHQLQSAVTNAKIAYKLGYPLPGLRNKLKADGVWDDKAAEAQP